MKICVVIPTLNRTDILEETIKRLLNQTVPPYRIVVVGSVPEDREITRRVDVDYIEHPNWDEKGKLILGKKTQAGIDYCRRYYPDAIMGCGSDDWLSSNWIETLSPYLKDYDVVGSDHLYSIDLNSMILLYTSYFDTPRYGEPMGPGRLISRRILEKLNWELYPKNLPHGLDGKSFSMLVEAGAKNFLYKEDEAKILSIKGNWEKLTDFQLLKTLPATRELEDANKWLVDNFVYDQVSIKQMGGNMIFGILAYDREQYFEYCLKNILQFARKVVVLESYEEVYHELEPEADFIFRVCEKINDSRVEHIPAGKVKNKLEMMQRLLTEVKLRMEPDEWCILQGADELWTPEAIRYLNDLPKEIVAAYLPFHNFCGDFNHAFQKRPRTEDIEEKAYDVEGNVTVRAMYEERALRVQPDWQYFENFTSISDADGNYIHSSPQWQDRRVYVKLDSPIRWAHYGYVNNWSWIMKKMLYHHHRAHPSLAGFERTRIFKYMAYDKDDDHKVETIKGFTHPYPMKHHRYYGKKKQDILKMADLDNVL